MTQIFFHPPPPKGAFGSPKSSEGQGLLQLRVWVRLSYPKKFVDTEGNSEEKSVR